MKRKFVVFGGLAVCLMSTYTVSAENNIKSIIYMINNIMNMVEHIDVSNTSSSKENEKIELTDKAQAYAILFDSVYDIDPGLNGDIKYISFAISTFEDFSDNDKKSFFEYIENKYDVEVLEKDFEQLKNEGYLQDLYFEEGILFKIDDYYKNSNQIISVNAEKWRSGLGAIWVDAEVIKENDEWILKKADMTAIS